ncbi:MaoC family dehydratase N-terminal domain-containing protein [Curtobacterium sp. VKM Ac-1395]|nr:MaoC family dehydratase N-terminal domain-containing protein [Curtobacterium sp. VKM Ac-1395]
MRVRVGVRVRVRGPTPARSCSGCSRRPSAWSSSGRSPRAAGCSPGSAPLCEDECVPHYLEDLAAGQTFTTPGRTITEADVVSFASWTNDNNQVHTDVEFAARTRYGQRIVHGMLGASLCVGLIARTGVFEGSAVALLGIDQWRFTAPVFIGDTVTCQVEILSTRLTSSGTTGIVERMVTLRNQHDEVVQQGRMDVMVLTRAAAIS